MTDEDKIFAEIVAIANRDMPSDHGAELRENLELARLWREIAICAARPGVPEWALTAARFASSMYAMRVS